MAAANDIAASVWKGAESIPVVGQAFTWLEKVGNVPVIKNIGDQIGDFLRGGKTIDYNSPSYLAQFSADQEKKAASLIAANDAKIAADAAAAGGVIDYGTTVVKSTSGLPKLIPVNKFGFVMVNGKQVPVPSTGNEIGIKITDQNASAVGQQILQNIAKGLPVTNQVPNASFSGASSVTSIQGNPNLIAYFIVAIALVVGVLIFTKK